MSRQIQRRDAAPVEKQTADLRTLIEQYKGEIARALPRHVTPERVIKIAQMAVRNSSLSRCHPLSFATALINCCSLGLEPNTSLGEAYLVPFKNRGVLECQLIIGYRGYIELAYRSGQVDWLYAACVYAEDFFQYKLGSHPKIEHEPNLKAIDRGPVLCAYAVCKMKDCAEPVFRVVGKAELDAARRQSQTGRNNTGPWSEHYDEMACKTAVRRLWKFLPLSSEDQRLRRLEDVETAGEKGMHASTGIDVLDNRSELEAARHQQEQLEQKVDDAQPPMDEPPPEHPEAPHMEGADNAPDAPDQADSVPAEDSAPPPQATLNEMRERELASATVQVEVIKVSRPQTSAKFYTAEVKDSTGAAKCRTSTDLGGKLKAGNEYTVVIERKTWGERQWLQIVDFLS